MYVLLYIAKQHGIQEVVLNLNQKRDPKTQSGGIGPDFDLVDWGGVQGLGFRVSWVRAPGPELILSKGQA